MEERYYHTQASVKEYIQLADGIDGREHINQLKMHLNSGAQVLELGTGPGKDWDILQEQYQVTGSDYSKAFLEHLRLSYPDGNFLQLDAATLETASTFDAIYSNKVLHHLTNENLEKSIERQAALLNPNGIICHTFWKGEGDEVFKGMYVNYHSENALKKRFKHKFKILQIQTYAEFEDGDSIRIIAQSNT